MSRKFRKKDSDRIDSKKRSEGARGVKSPVGFPRGRHVVGVHSVREVIKVRPRSIHSIWIKKGENLNEELSMIVDLAEREGISLNTCSESQLGTVCSSHQNVLAVVTEKPKIDWDSLDGSKKKELIILLDSIEDPHNLGAILRTAWLMGASGILIPQNRSVSLTPTAMKVACGGAEHVAVEEQTNLLTSIEKLKKMGFWVYGLAGETKQSIWDTDFSEKVALVVGAEDKGIRPLIRKNCDQIVSIPQLADGASYNASVAAAIAMSEIVRQRI